MSSSVKSCQVVSNQQKVVSSSHVKDEKYCQVMSSDANHAETPCPRVASAYTPPIDESRSGPARSAVNQAKTHFEQEAELAIMHAKKTHSSPRRAEPTCIAKEVIIKRIGRCGGGTPWTMVCVCSACACALQPSRTAARGSRIPDLGSGIGESGAGCVGDLGRGHQRAYIRHHRDDSSPATSQRSIFIPNPHSKAAPDPR